jgi:glyoxylase I family protein
MNLRYSTRMRVHGFHHLAIQVLHLESCAAFYREVLGLPELKRHRRPDGSVRSIWLQVGEGFLALEEVDQAPEETPFRHPRPGLHLIALRISKKEREAMCAELASRGVPLEHQTQWTVYVRDPEGNRVGLSHHPD